MQTQPTVGWPTPWGKVIGLGVCDALAVELDPVQAPWLIDELEEMRGPLEEEWQRLVAQQADSDDQEVGRNLEAVGYRLRLLRMMRARIPAVDSGGPAVLVGPTSMVLDVVQGATRCAAEAVSAAAHDQPCDVARLRETAEAARAWAGTLAECRFVEQFRFDPDADPPPGA